MVQHVKDLTRSFNMAMLWKLPVAFIVEKQWLRDGNSVERTANRYRIYGN
jgi:TPP-dependent pyruvate/acetoin dehydrogenase alpha subunit